jgi:hypothetical protein
MYISFHKHLIQDVVDRIREGDLGVNSSILSIDPYLAKLACCHLTQRLKVEGMTPRKWNGITGVSGREILGHPR